jgi:hypothetical protein
MKNIFYSLIASIASLHSAFADEVPPEFLLNPPEESYKIASSTGIIGALSLIQAILLKLVLPLVIVGASLYIAYQLFTAEGDETKLKKAWKSVAYSAVALVAIALSVAIVQIISQISL